MLRTLWWLETSILVHDCEVRYRLSMLEPISKEIGRRGGRAKKLLLSQVIHIKTSYNNLYFNILIGVERRFGGGVMI